MLPPDKAMRSPLGLIIILGAIALAGCSSGGSSPVPQQQLQQSATTSVPFSAVGVPISLPSLLGYNETITLPPNDAPIGAALSLTVSTTLPSGTPAIPATFKMTKPFLFFTLSSSKTVTLQGFPALSLILPRGQAWNGGPLHLAFYDPAGGWKHVGEITLTGSTLTFAGNRTPITLLSNVKYVALPFACVATNIFVTNRNNTITVYDEKGDQLATSGTFPNLSSPVGIAFDSNTNHLYVTDTSTVTVYDEQGNQIATTGSFAGGSDGIAFDTNNHHLTLIFQNGSVLVFDEAGNPITTTGTFPTFGVPEAITFDSNNHQIYVLSDGSATTYDEQGNLITISGTFPNVNMGIGIAFDPNNRHLYVANVGATVTVYDEQGHQVSTTGSFPIPTGSFPEAIAFDTNNSRVYLGLEEGAAGGVVTVYDEQGNPITTSGTFPNTNPFGLVAAPQ